MKRYEKSALARFFSLFWGAFLLMFVLLATLYYAQEHTRLTKELELTQQMNYIECMKLELEENCTNTNDTTPEMASVYRNILYAFGLVLLIFMPISLYLSYFSLRPVHRASTMIDNFIANIVHDINTPISTIMLNTKSLLRKNTLLPKKLERILSSAKQLTDMQHDLLALADEKEEIVFERVEITTLVEEILEGFALQYPSQIFESELNSHTVSVNPVDLRRILQNLLSNAIKYNRDNNPIKLYQEAEKLVIKDQGKGIKMPEKVFEKNYREDYTVQGNGLGLASVLAMSKRNHITLEVTSQFSVGTTIKLNFH